MEGRLPRWRIDGKRHIGPDYVLTAAAGEVSASASLPAGSIAALGRVHVVSFSFLFA